MPLKHKIKKHAFVIDKCPLGRMIESVTQEDKATRLEASNKGMPKITLEAATPQDGDRIEKRTIRSQRQARGPAKERTQDLVCTTQQAA